MMILTHALKFLFVSNALIQASGLNEPIHDLEFPPTKQYYEPLSDTSENSTHVPITTSSQQTSSQASKKQGTQSSQKRAYFLSGKKPKP